MKRSVLLILVVFLRLYSFAIADDLATVAESSGWLRTGRAEETEKLCKLFSKRFPKRVSCHTYGTTPEGRRLWYMEIQDAMAKKNAPIVWVQAGIHAGEIDGKDAVFFLLKNALMKKMTSDPFQGLRVVFIPIVNLDGHERFGKWNRPNQVGPEETGWRTTGQNYNLNRDFAKVDAIEMQALNKLWGKFKPIISLDLHVTNGAHFQPEIGIIVTPTTHHGSTSMHVAGKEFENILMGKMKSRGRLALPFYPAFEDKNSPLSGFSRSVSPPRFANGYWFVRNRIGVLVESHSWKDYATRVKAHHDTVLSSLEIAQEKGKEWTKAAEVLDRENWAGKTIDVTFKHSSKSSMIDFPAYKYTVSKSKVSGSEVIRYRLDQPEVWKVPFFEELLPVLSVTAPVQGYFIPQSEFDLVKQQLDVHGIQYQNWLRPLPKRVNVFRASKSTFSPNSFEGRQTLSVEGDWKEEKIESIQKFFFVPIHQPNSLLIVHLFEPLAPDSFVSWGLFNRFFEMKEYMEDYVVEDVALDMMNDKTIKNEFEERLKDESFAKDPVQRFRFFYKKHSSWDERYARYPIFKL